MKRFPVLISIPHGGTEMPPRLEGRVCLAQQDLFDDMDPFTLQIFDIETYVSEIVMMDIARAFVDMNRAPGDLPPGNPDGVIKSMTCYKKTIYRAGKEPDEGLRDVLLKEYYHPYHRQIQEIIGTGEIEFALDCHSMAAEPPPIAPDGGNGKGGKRPLICLGNAHDKSCSRDTVEELAACFREAFSLEKGDVSVNSPFSGGYITQTYGNSPVPWVQVELNRALYLSSPWFDPETRQVDNSRLMELSDQFREALRLFFE